MKSVYILSAATLAMAATASAGPILYTVAADAYSVPDQLIRIDTNTGTTSFVTQLGAGATSFAGGIYGAISGFAGFEYDSFSNASIVVYDTSGVVLNTPPIGTFLPGGLTFDEATTTIYHNENDSVGDWHLKANGVEIYSGSGELATGLTFDPAAAMLYVLTTNSSGDSSLVGINPATSSVTSTNALGTGFYGGVAWDPASSLFYLVQSDALGAETLYSYALGNPSPTALFALTGRSGSFASLTVSGLPEDAAVPEPQTWMLLMAGLGFLGFRKRLNR